MGESQEAPDWEHAMNVFRSWIDDVQSFEVIDPEDSKKSPFLPTDELKKYFSADNHRRLKELISIHFQEPRRIWHDDIFPDKVAVFCTLLIIKKGRWINHFCHHDDCNDTSLPFDPTRPPPSWPQGADFLPQFCEAQWKFCAPVFRKPFVGKKFAKDMVLPIVHKEILNNEGSSASLWLIKVHPSYNKLISEEEKQRLGPLADTFVMKTYFTSQAERYYNTEVAAFRHLGSNPSIIKFHGSFSRGESYNVLLEFADKGTLADYFNNEIPPSEGEEIIRFWESMFQLIDGLRRIHEVGDDGADSPPIFKGRHKDVKPENVLIVSNGSEDRRDWVFKLADLGISNFKATKLTRQDSSEMATRGTRTYGAPESYRPDETNVHDTLMEGQNSDIWSLGCIYSEACRWLKDGKRGIQTYRHERQLEISSISDFRDGDCFHDGEKILKSVRKSHNNSGRNLRTDDFITQVVVGLVGDMLDRAEARPTAWQLYHRSRKVIAEARYDLDQARAGLDQFSPNPRRSFSTPGQSQRPRPPPPPNPPPGYFPTLTPPAVPQDLGAIREYGTPSSILEPPTTTAEPEVISNAHFRFESSGQTRSNESLGGQRFSITAQDENKDLYINGQRPNTMESIISFSPSSHDMFNNPLSYEIAASLQSSPIPATIPETQLESNFSPQPTNDVSMASIPRQSSSPTMALANIPERLPSSQQRHPNDGAVRPKPEIIQSPPLPKISLQKALEWRRKRKGKSMKKPLEHSQYLERLRGRDHVFLIDDSSSMQRYWENVQQVFETLSYIVKEADPDGFDLWFTGTGPPTKNWKQTTDALELVENRRKQGTTDITTKLTKIFEDYIDALHKPKSGVFSKFSKPAKPLSLYVLTDGVWESQCNPGPLVESFVLQLQELHKVKGQVGIQFISFGSDPVGLERMDFLDWGLKVKLDIVDTEPWNGNVWKMLLGAINSSFDIMNDKYKSEDYGEGPSSNRMSMLSNSKDEYL